MSRTQHLRALANDPGATDGERAAARRALDLHEHKLQTAIPEPEPLPPGPNLTRSGGSFPAREHDGLAWVAVRGIVARQRAGAFVEDRRRMLVKIGVERFAMIPTAVEVDDERQQVYVTAPIDSLTEW